LRRPLLIALCFIVLLVLGVAGKWLLTELETPYYNAPTNETYIKIPHGAKTSQITDLLVGNGILHSRLPFSIYVRYYDLGRQFQAGEYRFDKPATPRQIARRLIRGDVYFHSITIPEGLTALETIDLLAKHGLGTADEFEKAIERTSWIRDINPAARSLEGYLFPETYRFGREENSEKIIKTMVNQFRLKYARLREEAPKYSDLSLPETVILASMIEKEVKMPEEASLVASVLINRLNRGMPLACDATIIYALKISGVYNGNLRKADLSMESPYNSYIHKNLPPGPISNPGVGSLRAALNPANTDYLYYVSRNDGTHQFSRDYQSHLHAVNRYQKSLSRRRSRN
jgi:UPF0755 protein